MKDWKIVIERLSLEDCYWKIVIERLSGTTWELGVGCRGEDIVWTGQRRLILVTIVNSHHRHHHRNDHHHHHHHQHHCHRPGGGGSNWWTSTGSDLPGGKVKSKSEKWKWSTRWETTNSSQLCKFILLQLLKFSHWAGAGVCRERARQEQGGESSPGFL